MFLPTHIGCDYCCVTFVSLFNLRYPRDFSRTHPEGEPCTYVYVNVFFFALRHLFSSGCGFFLVLSALWYAGSPPEPRAQVWALAEVCGTCSGGS